MNKKTIFLQILILSAALVAVVWFFTEPVNAPLIQEPIPTKQTVSIDTKQPETAQTKPSAPSSPKQISQPATPTPIPTEIETQLNGVELSFSVGDKRYFARVAEGATFLELMRAVSSTSDFSFGGRDYAGMGLLVETINGKKASGGYYWILKINGKPSDLGVTSYIPKPSDSILWSYEEGY